MSKISQDAPNLHSQEIKKVVDILSKITSRSPQEIKPYLDELLSRLGVKPSPYADHFFNTSTDDEWIAAFSEWSQSHKGKKLPVLSEDAMSRDSIYDERS